MVLCAYLHSFLGEHILHLAKMDRTMYFYLPIIHLGTSMIRTLRDSFIHIGVLTFPVSLFPASEFFTKDTIIYVYCQSLSTKGHCISPKELILRSWAHVLFGWQVDLWRGCTLHNGHSVKGRGEGYEVYDTAGLTQAESLQVPTLERLLHRWHEHFWDFFSISTPLFPSGYTLSLTKPPSLYSLSIF